ncbi:MAG: DNA repair protein RecN [Lachnospiraceae bacterium]|nr:DNA repair protein RecN [Lachnospiraceae bacterium]
MLVNVHVKNLALIEEVEISFENGLNILTGETGAGKSILIGSITLALGAKISGNILRNSEEEGLVELLFHIESQEKLNQLKELGVGSLEDGDVIISRKIMPNRSLTRVNGETRTLNEVREIAGLLINIHGQQETNELRHDSYCLGIVDQYCQKDSRKVLKELSDAHQIYRKLSSQYEELQLNDSEILREKDLLTYEIQEIESTPFHVGEDFELEETYHRFTNAKKLEEHACGAYELLSEKDQSVSDLIGLAYRELQSVASLDEEGKDLLEQIQNLEDLVNGLNMDLSNYRSSLLFDEEEFQEVEDHLNDLNRLKEKYGPTLEDVLENYNIRVERLNELEHLHEKREEVGQELESSKKKFFGLCDELSAIRKKASKELSKEIIQGLKELNFLDVQFEIVLEKVEPGKNGYDKVIFMISTNPGVAMQPVATVASGGELSRIMLAIKTVLSHKDGTECLIFDEVDAGISGRTAQMVSEKLAVIGSNHQTICITHLPQIAAMADYHFCIKKDSDDQETKTRVYLLKETTEKVEELSRLLGGAKITEQVRKNAEEMLALAKEYKSTHSLSQKTEG